MACTQNGQCCHGQCTYGRCKKDAAPGAPGTFCDRHDDCKDPPGTCCVRCALWVGESSVSFGELQRHSDGHYFYDSITFDDFIVFQSL